MQTVNRPATQTTGKRAKLWDPNAAMEIGETETSPACGPLAKKRGRPPNRGGHISRGRGDAAAPQAHDSLGSIYLPTTHANDLAKCRHSPKSLLKKFGLVVEDWKAKYKQMLEQMGRERCYRFEATFAGWIMEQLKHDRALLEACLEAQWRDAWDRDSRDNSSQAMTVRLAHRAGLSGHWYVYLFFGSSLVRRPDIVDEILDWLPKPSDTEAAKPVDDNFILFTTKIYPALLRERAERVEESWPWDGSPLLFWVEEPTTRSPFNAWQREDVARARRSPQARLAPGTTALVAQPRAYQIVPGTHVGNEAGQASVPSHTNPAPTISDPQTAASGTKRCRLPALSPPPAETSRLRKKKKHAPRAMTESPLSSLASSPLSTPLEPAEKLPGLQLPPPFQAPVRAASAPAAPEGPLVAPCWPKTSRSPRAHLTSLDHVTPEQLGPLQTDLVWDDPGTGIKAWFGSALVQALAELFVSCSHDMTFVEDEAVQNTGFKRGLAWFLNEDGATRSVISIQNRDGNHWSAVRLCGNPPELFHADSLPSSTSALIKAHRRGLDLALGVGIAPTPVDLALSSVQVAKQGSSYECGAYSVISVLSWVCGQEASKNPMEMEMVYPILEYLVVAGQHRDDNQARAAALERCRRIESSFPLPRDGRPEQLEMNELVRVFGQNASSPDLPNILKRWGEKRNACLVKEQEAEIAACEKRLATLRRLLDLLVKLKFLATQDLAQREMDKVRKVQMNVQGIINSRCSLPSDMVGFFGDPEAHEAALRQCNKKRRFWERREANRLQLLWALDGLLGADGLHSMTKMAESRIEDLRIKSINGRRKAPILIDD